MFPSCFVNRDDRLVVQCSVDHTDDQTACRGFFLGIGFFFGRATCIIRPHIVLLLKGDFVVPRCMDPDMLGWHPEWKDGCYLGSTNENDDPLVSRTFCSFDLVLSRIVFSMTVLICIFGLVCLFCLVCYCRSLHVVDDTVPDPLSPSCPYHHKDDPDMITIVMDPVPIEDDEYDHHVTTNDISTQNVVTEDGGYDGDDDVEDDVPNSHVSDRHHPHDFYPQHHHFDFHLHCPDQMVRFTKNRVATNPSSGFFLCSFCQDLIF